jgi:N-acyl-D-aspartate/D-glutamate deacylase
VGKEKLRHEIYKGQKGWDNMVTSIGWDRILIGGLQTREHAGWCGKTMEQVARENNYADPSDLLCDLVVEERGSAGIIVLSMAREDIDTIARLPWTALISDSLYGGGAYPHPRLHGAFPKFLREYAGERKILPMEQVIAKMTALPAERAGIKNRGRLFPGYFADVLVFDPSLFTDHANYTHPAEQASGMDTVILNGIIVRKNGKDRGKAGSPVFRV